MTAPRARDGGWLLLVLLAAAAGVGFALWALGGLVTP
jgi:hypothetical protein